MKGLKEIVFSLDTTLHRINVLIFMSSVPVLQEGVLDEERSAHERVCTPSYTSTLKMAVLFKKNNYLTVIYHHV